MTITTTISKLSSTTESVLMPDVDMTKLSLQSGPTDFDGPKQEGTVSQYVYADGDTSQPLVVVVRIARDKKAGREQFADFGPSVEAVPRTYVQVRVVGTLVSADDVSETTRIDDVEALVSYNFPSDVAVPIAEIMKMLGETLVFTYGTQAAGVRDVTILTKLANGITSVY